MGGSEALWSGCRQSRAELTAAKDQEMRLLETSLWKLGYSRVLGMDEVGRGSLAGPVTVAGVIMYPGGELPGVRDSKTLSAAQRNALFGSIKVGSVAIAVVSRDQAFIDEHGIVAAVKHCQVDIVNTLGPDYLLLDAFSLPEVDILQQSIVKGDSKSVSIAAASIVAKVVRDAQMTLFHEEYPTYNFASNKGYSTKEHRRALLSYGSCRLHRQSFLGSLHLSHA